MVNTNIFQSCKTQGVRHGMMWMLKVIYHPLYSMNNFVTNKSKFPQDGAQVFPYMG